MDVYLVILGMNSHLMTLIGILDGQVKYVRYSWQLR